MSVQSIETDASRVWTVEDLFAIDDDFHRYEIADGVLEMSPAPGAAHASIISNLIHCLVPQLQSGYSCLSPGVGVGRSYREPDVVVATGVSASLRGVLFPVANIVLAAEVVSPSSGRNDRVVKPREYAQAGIPVYVLIEPEERAVSLFMLDESARSYRLVQRGMPGDIIELTEPLALRLPVADIFR